MCRDRIREFFVSDGGDVSPCCVMPREEILARITEAEDAEEAETWRRAGEEARAALAARAAQPVKELIAA